MWEHKPFQTIYTNEITQAFYHISLQGIALYHLRVIYFILSQNIEVNFIFLFFKNNLIINTPQMTFSDHNLK